MSYDVHITRADQWFDGPDNPIPLSDWLDYISRDPEMRLDGEASATTTSGDSVCYVNEGLAVWTKYSRAGEGGGQAWFDYRQGCIVVKNPDDEILRKMCVVAEVLAARVQGDDGEFYDEA